MMYVMDGAAINELTADGQPLKGDTLLVLINGFFKRKIEFRMPKHRDASQKWTLSLCSDRSVSAGKVFESGDTIVLDELSTAVLRMSIRERKYFRPWMNKLK